MTAAFINPRLSLSTRWECAYSPRGAYVHNYGSSAGLCFEAEEEVEALEAALAEAKGLLKARRDARDAERGAA